jgi:hypothetical protein
MGMTYYLEDCAKQDAFCAALIAALPDDVMAVRQPKLKGCNVASLYLERSGDLYTLVTDTLREKVSWELWSAVGTHRLDPHTADAVAPRQLFG